MKRARAFSSIQRSKTKNALDELAGFIMEAWTPKDAPSPWLSLSIHTSIAARLTRRPISDKGIESRPLREIPFSRKFQQFKELARARSVLLRDSA